MSRLVKASELHRKPVVTLGGEDVAEVKDVVFDSTGGSVVGFTLNGRGLFAGPLKTALPWAGLTGCGMDALMVADESVLADRAEVLSGGGEGGGAGGDVIGSRVLTDSGTLLGTVTDVIIDVEVPAASADVVGYQATTAEAAGGPSRTVYIPLPDTLSVSGEALLVPATATDFVCEDLAGFGAAVDDFRERLRGGGSAS